MSAERTVDRGLATIFVEEPHVFNVLIYHVSMHSHSEIRPKTSRLAINIQSLYRPKELTVVPSPAISSCFSAGKKLLRDA